MFWNPISKATRFLCKERYVRKLRHAVWIEDPRHVTERHRDQDSSLSLSLSPRLHNNGKGEKVWGGGFIYFDESAKGFSLSRILIENEITHFMTRKENGRPINSFWGRLTKRLVVSLVKSPLLKSDTFFSCRDFECPFTPQGRGSDEGLMNSGIVAVSSKAKILRL